ncbi:ABC transporter permease [Hymenobacter cellulosivorans]|uniref:ABC transporter permease n=1 Tax=Hymenobacter cellulosivorans TaxID=2932249 RepID=A0ABY4F4S9_9BACT|nr:ABC transporter permease [Hymenobacter cellulosivorans]UOQ51469.1 ABC transporter permease [Hymenobacter cellulosivorans]
MFRAELRKILPYRTVWVILLLYVVLLAGFVSVGGSVTVNGQQLGNTLYAFPELWSRLAYVASYFNLLLGILLIILITDEFQFRTFRQQVIDGSSVAGLVQGKLAVSGLLALYGVLAVLGVGFFFGLTRSAETLGRATETIGAVLLYGVQALGYVSLAGLLGFLLRKAGPAFLGFLLYAWVVEPLLRFGTPDQLDRFFPVKILDSLTPTPGRELLATVAGPSSALLPTQAAPLALAYIGLFWLLSYLLLRSRDL